MSGSIAADAVVPHATPPDGNTAGVLLLDRVTKSYRSRDRLPLSGGKVRSIDAVRDVTLKVERGEVLAVVGESGSGKSTLARLMVRLERPSEGRILFEGVDVTSMSRRRLISIRRSLQITFQDPGAALDPRMTVRESMSEPLAIHGLLRDGTERRAEDLLNRVGLAPDLMARYPHELSGGQKQRIGLARALAVAPRVLVLDEPLSALDTLAQQEVLDLLTRLRKELGLTYVFISHDLRAVRRIATRIAVMSAGRIVEVADAGSFFQGARDPYSRALLQAFQAMASDADSR